MKMAARRAVGMTVALLVVAGLATGPSPATAAGAPSAGTGIPAAEGWVNAWQASPTPGGTIPGPDFTCPADKGVHNQTVRNIVFLSTGGDSFRVRLTNAFGSKPLQVGAASVAYAGKGAATLQGTNQDLRFGGRPSVLVAAGSEARSDPVRRDGRALA